MDHHARVAEAVLRASRMLAAVARNMFILQLIVVMALAPLAAPMHSATMPVSNSTYSGSCLSCLTVTIGARQNEIPVKSEPALPVTALVSVEQPGYPEAGSHETCTITAARTSSSSTMTRATGPIPGDKRPGLLRRVQTLLEDSFEWVGQCLRSCNDSIDVCADRIAAVMDSDAAMAGWRHTNKSKAFAHAAARSSSLPSSNTIQNAGASAGKGPADAPTAPPAPTTSEILKGLFAVSLIGSGMALILQIS